MQNLHLHKIQTNQQTTQKGHSFFFGGRGPLGVEKTKREGEGAEYD
jgi:hypothetical protein